MRAYTRGLVPVPPLARLTGMVITQVAPGATTWTMPASPWLMVGPTVVPEIVLSSAMSAALHTTVPAATFTRPVSMNHRPVRLAVADGSSIVVRAESSYAGRTRGAAVAQAEDARGRLLSHASMSAVFEPMSPPPPPARDLEPVEVPSHQTPDPHARAVTDDLRRGVAAYADQSTAGMTYVRAVADGTVPPAPFSLLTGLEICGVDEGEVSTRLPVTPWLAAHAFEVEHGVLHHQMSSTLGLTAITLRPAGHETHLLDSNVSYLRPVAHDQGPLVARARVTHQHGERMAVSGDIIDVAGDVVAVGSSTWRFAEPGSAAAGPAVDASRTLATVLFTDLVGSTEHATRLGDREWRALLDQHHAALRRELATYGGREIKTTGDGFLATFDAPGRAIHCARAARDAVRRLGLELTAGIHTGECDISDDDIAGIAVHIAARVHAAAGPGDILVSGTVRDLCTGSGLRFAERGRRQLKGVDGEWVLYAVES